MPTWLLDILNRIKKEANTYKIKQQAESTFLSQLIGNSGLADSLANIAGTRLVPNVSIDLDPHASVNMQYQEQTPNILEPTLSATTGLLRPNSTTQALPGRTVPDKMRFVIAHEYGHQADKSTSWLTQIAKAVHKVDPNTLGQVPLEDRVLDEQYGADTFASAFLFLQSPYSRGKDAIDYLAKYEESQPGISAVVDRLLAHRIYQRHPMNKPLNRR